MTIHATPLSPTITSALGATSPLGFAVGTGRPSHHQFMTTDACYMEEDLFVKAMRGYTDAIAQRSLSYNPAQYEAFIATITSLDPEDDLTFRDVRFAYLLHTYANYLPSPDCTYIDSGLTGCHAWQAPDGGVLIDIVTTLALTELSPVDDQVLVGETLSEASRLFGPDLIGVRLIVLDAAFESTFYDTEGLAEPLAIWSLALLAPTTGSAL